MRQGIRMSFEAEGRVIELDQILPSRLVTPAVKKSPRYLRIQKSIEQLGVIEPLIVYPQGDRAKKFLLLDGHIRLSILKDQGVTEVLCLISTDDEGLTYNHKVSQVQAIQEHFMIMKAINAGVSEQRIAATLNVDVTKIKEKRNLLDGICREAVELLRNRNIASKALSELKKVKPMRQIEMADLMIAANNHTYTYARAMVLQTAPELRLEQPRDVEHDAPTAEQIARIEREVHSVTQQFRQLEETYGRNVLNLVLIAGYLKKLLNNAAIIRFLSQKYADLLVELQKIAEAASLEQQDDAEEIGADIVEPDTE